MIEQTQNKMVFLISENQNVFPFNIRFFAPDEIEIYLEEDSGTVKKLIPDIDFTVEKKTDYSAGADITLLTGSQNIPVLPVGKKLSILRVLPIVQKLSLPEYGKLPSKPLEIQLDKLTMICQQLKEQTSRGIQVPPGGNTTPEALLSSIWQANADSMIAASAAAESATAAATSASASAESAESAAESAQHAEDVSHPLGNGAFNRSDGDAFFRNSFNSLRIWWADQFSPEEAQLLSYDEEAQVYKTDPLEDENADQIQYQLEWRTGGQSSAQAMWHLAKYVNSVEEESFLCRIPNSSSDDPRGNGFPVSGNDQNTLKFTVLGDSDKFLGSLKTGTSERLARNLRNEILNRVWISEEFRPESNTLFQFSHNLNLSEEDLNRARADLVLYWKSDTDSYGYTNGDIIQYPVIVAYLTGNSQVTAHTTPFAEVRQNTVLFPFHSHISFYRKDSLGTFISVKGTDLSNKISAKIRIFY